MMKFLQLIVLLGMGSGLLMGQSLESEYRRKGDKVRVAFEEVRRQFGDCSAVLYGWREVEVGEGSGIVLPAGEEGKAGEEKTPKVKLERKRRATPQGYGVVVSSDGYILVKTSELDLIKELAIVIDRERYEEVKRVASDVSWDVTLLKIEAKDLKPVRWLEVEPEMGTMVFSNSGTSRFERRAQLGVISAKARKIGGEGLAALGVAMEGKDGEGLEVKEVSEKSGAAEAGIEKGDVLLRLEGEVIGEAADFLEKLKEKQPGERVKLAIRRGEEEREVDVEMKARSEIYPALLSRNDIMSGEFSERRTHFPRVIQHDTPMARRTVGGPLLNKKGECVGMNIAFATREASYAIPAKEARLLFEKLRGS